MKIDLHLGKCDNIIKTIPSGSVDLLLQDLPYGVTANEWDQPVDLQIMWPEWLRIAKPNAAFIFTAQQPFATDLIMSNRKLFRYDLIWYKALGSGFLNANRMPLRNHEHILVFYRSLPTYNPQMTKGKRHKKGGKRTTTNNNYGTFTDLLSSTSTVYQPQSVIDITNGNRASESDHPTQKPVELFRYLIRTYSNPGDTVYDGYSGSGTTPLAAEVEGRNCIAIEKKPEYYQMGVDRQSHYHNSIPLFQ